MSSLRARFVRGIASAIFKRINADSNVQLVRGAFEKVEAFRRPARNVVVREADVAGVDCEWLVPRGAEQGPLLYYLHGGAYLMGSPRTHRRMVSHIAKRAGYRAVLPDYALAPESPFPAGLTDCIAVYRALVDSGEDPARIVIGGDSAGGGMTMATLLSLREAGDPLPGATLLLSPWLDLTGSGESMQTRADRDPFFRAVDLPEVALKYADQEELRNPLVSPVFADVDGLPPVLIQVGDDEILLSDSERIAEKFREAGVRAELQVWPQMWHVFQFLIGHMPESKAAIMDMARFMKSVLNDA